MKKVFLSLVLLLAACGAIGQTSFQRYLIVTTTNVNGSTNILNAMTINGSTRIITNNISAGPSTRIQATNTMLKAATNIQVHLKAYPPPGLGLQVIPNTTNSVKVQAGTAQSLSFSFTGDWGYITMFTNPIAPAVSVRVPWDTYDPTNQTNYASQLTDGLRKSTNSLQPGDPILKHFEDLTTPQTSSNKTTRFNTNESGMNTNVELKGVYVSNYVGGTNGYGIRFGNNWLINDGAQLSLVQGDGSPAEPVFGSHILTLYWGNLIYPTFGGINNFFGTNTYFGTNWFRGGFTATNAHIINLVVTNGNGTFDILIATNLFSTTIVAGNATIGSGSGTFGTLLGTNFTALGGYIGGVGAGSLFIDKATISNAWNIGGIGGTIVGGLFQGPTANSLQASNTLLLGVNNNSGDIAYPWYELNTVANGNNPALPIGTNVYIRLSGNSAPASIIGIAGGRTGRSIRLLNASGAAITLTQNTSDPTTANRLIANVTTDFVLQPGDWIDLSWITADGKWRFAAYGQSGHYTLYSQTIGGVATNISTVETSILGSGGGTRTLSAGYWTTNKITEFDFDGRIWTGATPDKSLMMVKLGTAIVASNLFAPTANLSGKPYNVHGKITCRTNSATGALYVTGRITTPNSSAYEAFTNTISIIDTTAAMAFDLTVTNGAVSTSIGSDNGDVIQK